MIETELVYEFGSEEPVAEIVVWHDEAQRLNETGLLDPTDQCGCGDCLLDNALAAPPLPDVE